MQIVILKDAKAVATRGARIFTQKIVQKPEAVIGLATGSTPLALYRQLIEATQAGTISFAKTTSFNLDEYLGISGEHPQSYRYFMNEQFFKHIDIKPENTFVPPGDTHDPIAACHYYDHLIKNKGGIDLQLLGIGRNGHIGFNEPSSGLSSRTRVKTLTEATIADNARFFKDGEFQPHLSITMGIGTIMDAEKIVLLAVGESKAAAIRATIEGPISASCPASILQMHKNTVVIIDEAAASQLEQQEFYQHIERENQQLLLSLGLTHTA